jgi:hypothetical protein
MGRGPISKRIAPFLTRSCDLVSLPGISTPFGVLSLSLRQVAHVLLTRPPLGVLLHLARLACMRHAASVRPEPGSNSPINLLLSQSDSWLFFELTRHLHSPLDFFTKRLVSCDLPTSSAWLLLTLFSSQGSTRTRHLVAECYFSTLAVLDQAAVFVSHLKTNHIYS